jgi:hypothetical protein
MGRIRRKKKKEKEKKKVIIGVKESSACNEIDSSQEKK